MAGLLYQIYSFTSLLALSLYHLVASTRLHLLSPQSFSAKPFHSLPALSNHPRLRHLPQHLTSLGLLIALSHHLILAFTPDPLLKGSTPVHTFLNLQSSALLLFFLLLSLSSLFLSPHFPLSLLFAFSSAAFFLLYYTSSTASSLQTSALQAKCDSVFALVSLFSSIFALVLAIKPRLYLADVGLSGSVCLQGFWALQSGLTLYVDAFIPDGCHKLLDVVSGVEGSTKCELEESKWRAVAILDLMFVVYVMVVVVVVMVVYAVTGRFVGGRTSGSYEALPTLESNSVQMKTLAGTQE